MIQFYTYRKRLFFCLLYFFALQPAFAQNTCPPNIDFEFGDFTNWQCYTGTTTSTGGGAPPNCTPGVNTVNAVPSAPIPGRHTIIPPTQNTDPFGGFYITPGSSATTLGTSNVARLGFVGQIGAQIERLSYTFTIPTTATTYSLQYKYAVVYQDPNHCQPAQPHFEAKVFDVTTGQYINCASFEYYATPGQNGFQQSTNSSQGIVYYKNWTPVTFILSDYIGHTIRVEFTNADCTATGHWAYCYVDVSNNCSSPVVGGKFCTGDPSVSLVAPYDYQAYNWYYAGFGAPISTNDTLTLAPPPTTQTQVAVEVIPFPGYGCRDTIWTNIIPLPAVPVNAGIDRLICPTGITLRGPDTLGTASGTNYTYSWVPTAGLSDASVAQPLANPIASTNYVLTMTDTATGCVRKDTVIVTVAEPVSATYTVNAPNQCLANNSYQFTSSPTNPAGTTFAWLFDGTNGSNQANPTYVYPVANTYTVKLTTTTTAGCTDTSSQVMIVSAEAIANAGADQTLCTGPGASTVIGTAGLTGYTYSWSPSTGLSSTTAAQPTASPATTTTYIVTATAPGNCSKKDTVVVSIVPGLSPAFTVNTPAQCLNTNNYQFTMTNPMPGLTYAWNFGETTGVNSTQQNPTNVYTTAGSYTVKVILSSPTGCKDSSTQTVTVYPTPAGTITAAGTNICEGTPVVLTVTGTPASTYKWYTAGTTLVGTTTTPTYNASQPGTYTVSLENNGCVNNGTGSVTLTLTKKPVVDFTIESSCLGNPTMFTDASNVSGSLPVDYLWNFGTPDLPPSTQPGPTVNYTKAGTYSVQYTITPQACPSLATTATKSVTVKGPTPNTRYSDKAALENVPLQLQARNIGSSYSWSPGTNLNNSNIMAPVFQGMTEMEYTITITDNLGCVTVDSQLVKVFKEVNIFMPKAFTPNGDGVNDRITPFTIGIKQIRLFRIINRWGVIVYEAKNDVKGWDGNFKGAPQPMDGYVWELQAVDYFGKNHTRQGSFTLIR